MCPEGAQCVDGVCIQANGAPIDTLAINVTFTPQFEGMVQETLVIANNESDGDEAPRTIELVGEGTYAHLLVSPDPIDLGTVYIGFPKTVTVALENTGLDQLDVNQVSVSDANLLAIALTSTLPTSVGPLKN